MYCPPEMAESFLRKWKDENTVLVVTMRGPRFTVGWGGTVTEFEIGAGLEICALAVIDPSGEVTAAPGNMTASLEDVSFGYVEPREAPSELREVASDMFVCVLTITSPDFTLSLTEMRDQPEHANLT